MHQQRLLGHENVLGKLERNIIDVELLVINLQNKSASIHLDDEKALHEIHQAEHKLFDLEGLIEEEILHILRTTGQTVAPSITTPNPVTVAPNPHIVTAKAVLAEAALKLQTYRGNYRNYIINAEIQVNFYLKTIENGHLTPAQLAIAIRTLDQQVATLRSYLSNAH